MKHSLFNFLLLSHRRHISTHIEKKPLPPHNSSSVIVFLVLAVVIVVVLGIGLKGIDHGKQWTVGRCFKSPIVHKRTHFLLLGLLELLDILVLDGRIRFNHGHLDSGQRIHHSVSGIDIVSNSVHVNGRFLQNLVHAGRRQAFGSGLQQEQGDGGHIGSRGGGSKETIIALDRRAGIIKEQAKKGIDATANHNI